MISIKKKIFNQMKEKKREQKIKNIQLIYRKKQQIIITKMLTIIIVLKNLKGIVEEKTR